MVVVVRSPLSVVKLFVVGSFVGASFVVPMLFSGCMVDLNSFQLCERDPEACDAPQLEMPALQGCTATEPLQVQIGTGEIDFLPLLQGEAPELHLGTPVQAADLRHLFVGVRIDNPDPIGGSFIAKFRVTEPLPGERGKTSPKTRDSVLRVVMKKSLQTHADGALSRGGLRMFLYEAPLRLAVTVEDQCVRSGTDSHEVTADGP